MARKKAEPTPVERDIAEQEAIPASDAAEAEDTALNETNTETICEQPLTEELLPAEREEASDALPLMLPDLESEDSAAANAPIPAEEKPPESVAEDQSYRDMLEELGESELVSSESKPAPTDEAPAPVAEETPKKRNARTSRSSRPSQKATASRPAEAPIRPEQKDKVLTIDAKEAVETEDEREATIWHEIQNAYRTQRILTGKLDAVEPTPNGMLMAVVIYKGFRVLIPMKEMMFHEGSAPRSQHHNAYVAYMDQLARIANGRVGSEIDFIVRGIVNETRSIVASRKDAMLKKRQIFYLDPDDNGHPMIYVGRVVQARVVAVIEKFLRVEVFGVECAIRARELSWEWIGNAHERYSIGDRILVRIQTIECKDIRHITITADVRSLSSATDLDNLQKCTYSGRYAGRVTDVRNGVVYIRLNNGANAIAHSCFDRRTPGKNDDVTFVVTRIDEDMGVAVGIIPRVIRQNL